MAATASSAFSSSSSGLGASTGAGSSRRPSRLRLRLVGIAATGHRDGVCAELRRGRAGVNMRVRLVGDVGGRAFNQPVDGLEDFLRLL